MTVSGFLLKISPRRSEEFSVNRPFLYAIVATKRSDKTDNFNPLTLFIGRIFMPNLSELREVKDFTFPE